LQTVTFNDIGLISYQNAWDLQRDYQKIVIDHKLALRENPDAELQIQPQHFLLFCEHPHVYTLGKSGSPENVLLNTEELEEKQIEFFKINRGGDITYHGPGQLVGYPIFDLDYFFNDIHKYVRSLEEAIIRTLLEYGIVGTRISGYTGVWLEDDEKKRKICAIGVHLSRWVTMHGFAFNVNNDLKYFDYIVPCGIVDEDKTVTSLNKELGRYIDSEEVKSKVKKHFADIFGYTYN
jgi:lipoyl(octanoyl) transferase